MGHVMFDMSRSRALRCLSRNSCSIKYDILNSISAAVQIHINSRGNAQPLSTEVTYKSVCTSTNIVHLDRRHRMSSRGRLTSQKGRYHRYCVSGHAALVWYVLGHCSHRGVAPTALRVCNHGDQTLHFLRRKFQHIESFPLSPIASIAIGLCRHVQRFSSRVVSLLLGQHTCILHHVFGFESPASPVPSQLTGRPAQQEFSTQVTLRICSRVGSSV